LRASLAKEIALDLLESSKVTVYSARTTSKLARQYGGQRPDTIVLVDRDGQRVIGRSREEVKRFFDGGVEIKTTTTTTTAPPTTTTITTTTKTYQMVAGENIYEADLESAIHYSLRQEMGLVSVFRDETLDALKSYVKLLAKYFPGREVVRLWLDVLDRKLDRVVDSLDHNQYKDLVEWSSDKAFLPERTNFLGCKGSEEGKRGYPCSLWTLFHTLTVSAYHHHNLTSRSSPEFKPEEVIEVMTKYVKNFFGCRHCAKHFLEMASEPRSIYTYDGSVLWLWHAHNRANFRLKGDETEDKQFPKQLFPSHKTCPHCRIGKHKDLPIWNMGNVLNFLGRMYSRLRFEEAPTVSPWTSASQTSATHRRFGPYRWFDYEGKGAVY